jgi:hypothetical protein
MISKTCSSAGRENCRTRLESTFTTFSYTLLAHSLRGSVYHTTHVKACSDTGGKGEPEGGEEGTTSTSPRGKRNAKRVS